MLIRSKNKMHIVNIENGVVSAEGGRNSYISCRKDKRCIRRILKCQKSF